MKNSVRQSENRKLSQNKKSQNYNLFKRAQSQFKIHHLPSISNYSTCCSNSCTTSQPQSCSKFEEENIENILVYKNTQQDPLSCFNYDDFKGVLPVTINGIKILKIDWGYFIASPNISSQWKAHCFWTVGYTFDINMKKMKRSQNIKYRLIIKSWCCLSNKSWVKNKWGRLLEHETGNYLIRCLCALDFKQNKIEQINTNILRIIEWNALNYFKIHSSIICKWRNNMMKKLIIVKKGVKQKEWNQFIKQELLKY